MKKILPEQIIESCSDCHDFNHLMWDHCHESFDTCPLKDAEEHKENTYDLCMKAKKSGWDDCLAWHKAEGYKKVICASCLKQIKEELEKLPTCGSCPYFSCHFNCSADYLKDDCKVGQDFWDDKGVK